MFNISNLVLLISIPVTLSKYLQNDIKLPPQPAVVSIILILFFVCSFIVLRIFFGKSSSEKSINASRFASIFFKPSKMFLDDEKIDAYKFINNGTHVWLNMKPDTSGEITIIGTTVIPEFPIIAPLAIGFLMILVLPFTRKFNLR